MANRILFDANDDKPYASKLWVSDGTTAGSTEISGSAGYDFTQLGGIVVFISGNGVLWRTNGTVAGTSQIVPATTVKFTGFSNSYLPASAQLAPQLLPIGNALLFLGDDGTHGSELWRTDGTAAGTTMVKDIYPGNTQSSRIADMTAFGNGYLFEALDDTHGLELFKTDGTTAGTVLVKDIEPNGITSGGTFYPYSSSPNNITVLGDGTKAVFAATVLTNNGSDREVWVTDGTAAGTTMVKQINADSGGAMPDNITQLGHTGRAVFQATDKPVNTPSYTKGAELWVTDGTAAGTTLIKDLDPGKQATLSGFKQIGDKLLFTSQEDGYGVYSPGLWVTDGTAVGTIKLLSSAITGAFGLVDFGSKELFWTNYNAGYSTPWITDGTVAGTIQLSATAVLGDSYGWAVLGSIALFSGDTGNYNGTELWQTDGTAAGTRVARDIYPEVNKSSYPQHFAVSTLRRPRHDEHDRQAAARHLHRDRRRRGHDVRQCQPDDGQPGQPDLVRLLRGPVTLLFAHLTNDILSTRSVSEWLSAHSLQALQVRRRSRRTLPGQTSPRRAFRPYLMPGRVPLR